MDDDMYSKSSVSSYARGKKPVKSYKRNILGVGVGAQAALSAVTEGARELWRMGKKSKLGKRLGNPNYTEMDGASRYALIRELQTELQDDNTSDSRGQAILKEIAKIKKADEKPTTKRGKLPKDRYMTVMGGYVLDMHDHGNLVGTRDSEGNIVDRFGNKINPGTPVSPECEDLSKEWHGRDVQGQTEIEETETFDDDLVDLGELEELGIWAADGSLYTISFKKDRPKLACDGNGENLEVIGGDQVLNLDDLGVEVKGKRLIPLGYCYSIVYESDKHHLEGSNGYPESYIHYFGEEFYKEYIGTEEITDKKFASMIEKGIVQDAIEDEILPVVVYNKTDSKILISGGSYEITELGIKN